VQVSAHARDGGRFSLILSKHESRESSVDITTPFLSYFPNFLLTMSSRPVLGPAQPHIQCGRLKRPEPEAVPRSRKLGSIHPLPHTPSRRSAELVKHRGNFTYSFAALCVSSCPSHPFVFIFFPFRNFRVSTQGSLTDFWAMARNSVSNRMLIRGSGHVTYSKSVTSPYFHSVYGVSVNTWQSSGLRTSGMCRPTVRYVGTNVSHKLSGSIFGVPDAGYMRNHNCPYV
jgi:hypothetical protein